MTMKLLLLLFIVSVQSLFSQKILVNDPSSPLLKVEQPFDVIHYDADIELMKAPLADMSGVCETTLTWVADNPGGNCFFFHLRGLTIDSIFFNGSKTILTTFFEPNSALYSYCVPAPSSVKKGDTSYIKVYYHGKMNCENGGNVGWCGGVTSTGGTLYTLGVGFFANYVSTTRHWLPCYDHPSDKATFNARFKVKNGMTVAGNGIGSMTNQDDTTLIYEWKHDIPCATYLYTFAVNTYVPLSFGTPELPMVVYSKPSDTASTRISFKLLPRMVRTFEKLYGKYPFEKVGYVNTPTGAMEHQTMIAFPTSLSLRMDTVNSVAAHELAHQWFGDAVSPEDFRHAWLSESPATFSETVWAEELGGKKGYIAEQDTRMRGYFTIAKSEGVFPLYDFPRAKPSNNYPTTIYSKGAVVLGMLRYEVGDSLFFASMRKYIEKFKYSVATTELFKSTFEEVTGRDLSWFFNQWVYRKGWPILEASSSRITVTGGEFATTVTLHQVQQDDSIFTRIPVEMTFFKDKDTLTSIIRDLSTKDTTFILEYIPDFTSMTINQGPTLRALLQTPKATAVDEYSPEKEMPELRIIPNPANSEMKLLLLSHSNCNAKMTVVNSIGETVLTKTVSVKPGDNSYTLDIKELPSGAYTVTLALPLRAYSAPLSVVK